MKSPLSLDQKTVEKYKVPTEVELHPRQKLAFLEEQLHQLKSMHYRARVDVLHATRLTESKNEVLKNKGHQNMATHINEVEQTVGAIQMISSLIKELREENPNIGDAQSADHPESQ